MICLLDSDIIVYKACFSTEYKVYHHKDFGTFRHKKDLTGFLGANFDEEDALVLAEGTEVEEVLEPVETTYDILESLITTAKQKSDSEHVELYVSGGGKKFRDSVKYPVVYKGNRPPKPKNYLAAWSYLLNTQKDSRTVISVKDIEVDDSLGIRQSKAERYTTIIATIDKDLKMIPGLHYHLDKQTITEVSAFEGYRNFCSQMLQGDRVDNVLGIDGIGPKTADKLLAPCINETEMDAVVLEQYQKAWPKTWSAMLESNKVLLWILREPLGR